MNKFRNFILALAWAGSLNWCITPNYPRLEFPDMDFSETEKVLIECNWDMRKILHLWQVHYPTLTPWILKQDPELANFIIKSQTKIYNTLMGYYKGEKVFVGIEWISYIDSESSYYETILNFLERIQNHKEDIIWWWAEKCVLKEKCESIWVEDEDLQKENLAWILSLSEIFNYGWTWKLCVEAKKKIIKELLLWNNNLLEWLEKNCPLSSEEISNLEEKVNKYFEVVNRREDFMIETILKKAPKTQKVIPITLWAGHDLKDNVENYNKNNQEKFCLSQKYYIKDSKK